MAIVNINDMALEYAKGFQDKSRIYFIERNLSTFNAAVGRLSPFMLFPRQKVFLRTLADNKAVISLKHRQVGCTTITAAWVTAQIVFADQDSPETCLCIGNKLDLSQQMITKIREFLLQVPRWYWGDEYYSPDPKSEKNKKDIFTISSKSELQLFNGCRVVARSSGPNAARGLSAVSILIFDEAAFIENGQEVYSSAVAATASVPNSKVVMVSTPNGKDELYYETYTQALDGKNNYKVVEFKWYQDLRYNKFLSWYKINKDTNEKKIYKEEVLDKTGTVEYNEEHWANMVQNGWTPTSPWYENMCRQFNNDSMKIAQELDCSFMGSANNVVSSEYIEQQRSLNVRDKLEDMLDPMVPETWFWKPPIDGHRYICSCLPEKEKVLTKRGNVNVEDVKYNDFLLTKEGEWTMIKHRKFREVINEEISNIKLYGIYNVFKFTWNHPIYCSKYNKKNIKKFSFINANEVKSNDLVCVPNVYLLNEKSDEEIVKYWKPYENEMYKCPLLNEEFWWYCGMWIAEGYIHKVKNTQRIHTVHNIKENYYYNRIENLAYNIFHCNFNVMKRNEYNCADVYITAKNLANFLVDTFGKYAYGKKISEWVKFIPKRFKLKLIEGYFNGDGWIDNGYYNAESVSLDLLCDIQDILFSCGITSSVKHKRSKGSKLILGKKVNNLDSYILRLSLASSSQLDYALGKREDYFKNVQKYIFLSNDKKTIYIKVKSNTLSYYSGKVFNFETENISHTFCCKYISTHNCDPSRGASNDFTAIEIIDIDGRDENNMPIVEQVAEFVGKRFGDEIGDLIFKYAKLYNNAYVVVDATGGISDSATLKLLSLGYKNLYYDDDVQKTYMLQNPSKTTTEPLNDKLPGFHFQGNRFPVLSNFAGMVRNNEFKIRSIRVINELETWIFKGDTGRMDHQSSSHDDTITSLAMALFIMKFSFSKLEATKSKDEAILKAYFKSNNHTKKLNTEEVRKKYIMPFYAPKDKTISIERSLPNEYMWLIKKI